MSQLEKLEGSKVKLTIEVDAEAFETALQTAYHKVGKNFNLPGFRKGHAPRKVIETAYGEGVFFEDAIEEAYPAAYGAAVDEHGISPVDRPEIDIIDVSVEKGFTFTATVAVTPEVELGQYKGIEVEKQEYNVTDEMVDSAIEREREKLARFVSVERPVENGDKVVLDYSGTVDGVKFDGGTAEDQSLVIGSGSFIPGFEEQMIGMSVGEHRDLNVKFPDEYHAEELKGKDAVFAVDVKEITVKELPELDDEFAKDVSDFDTLEELRADKRGGIEKELAEQAKAAKEDKLIKAAVANAKLEIPDAMTERQLAYMLNDISYSLSMQGISLEDYFKFTGTTMDDIRKEYRPEAEQRVKTQLVIDAIVKAEAFEAAEAEIDEAVAEYAKRAGQSAEEFKSNLKPDDMQYFTDKVLVDKAIKLIVDSSVEK